MHGEEKELRRSETMKFDIDLNKLTLPELRMMLSIVYKKQSDGIRWEIDPDKPMNRPLPTHRRPWTAQENSELKSIYIMASKNQHPKKLLHKLMKKFGKENRRTLPAIYTQVKKIGARKVMEMEENDDRTRFFNPL